MATIYIAFKISALLVTALLPLGGLKKGRTNRNYIELSNWAVNEKGLLEDLSVNQPGNHPIRIK